MSLLFIFLELEEIQEEIAGETISFCQTSIIVTVQVQLSIVNNIFCPCCSVTFGLITKEYQDCLVPVKKCSLKI